MARKSHIRKNEKRPKFCLKQFRRQRSPHRSAQPLPHEIQTIYKLNHLAIDAPPNMHVHILTTPAKDSLIAPRRSSHLFAYIAISLTLFTIVGMSQTTESGAISGRIYNPATGEYLRSAQVRIQESGRSTTSESGGFYQISGIAPGNATIVVTYTGYRPITATVSVAPGGTVIKDFDLVSALAGDERVELEKFVVTTEREGYAKAIMDQRSSMNITNIVASDVFGDDTEGNVANFLKNMPGVELNVVGGDPRNVRLRGLSSEYTSVTIDGMSLASADANAGNRAFSFESVSMSSMEAVEVLKTISADVDANAPAGTINLRTKNAFDREGRRISWQTNVSARTTQLSLNRSRGPDDHKIMKIRPGGMFEYSDVLMNKKLGVILNLSYSSMFGQNTRAVFAYNYVPTAADPRPVVPTSLAFTDSMRIIEKFTTTLTTDFRATPHLSLSLRFIYSDSELRNTQRRVTFNNGNRATVIGADPLVSFTTSATNASVASNPIYISKPGRTITYLPRAEYKRGPLTIEGKFAISDAISYYDPLSRRGSIFRAGASTLSGITYRAERSSATSADWRITQLAGPDLSSGAGYTSPNITLDDARFSRTQQFTGDVSATLATNRILPVIWKTGVKGKRDIRNFRNDEQALIHSYTGPGSGTGAWAGYRSQFDFDMSDAGAYIRSTSGQNVFLHNLTAIGDLYLKNPNYFTPAVTATNYYTAFVANKRYYIEDVKAAFMMGTTNIGKAVLRGGLRWEETRGNALETDPRTAAEVVAAGFPVSSGRATTIPGIDYQFFSKPKVNRRGSYNNLFPSASLKYNVFANLDVHLGYSSTVKRPGFSNVAGVFSINDENSTVTAPNRGLKPETSDNFSVRMAYYFEPVGLFAVNGYQNSVKDLHLTRRVTAEQFGYTGDPDLSTYDFQTTVNTEERVTIRGLELEYNQRLSFLPNPFKGLGVRASYSRNYANIIITGMSPHSATAGLSYRYGRFNAYVNGTWNDDVPFNETGTIFVYRRTNIDAGGGIHLTKGTSLFFTARNLFDNPWDRRERRPGTPAVVTIPNYWGTQITAGVKGAF